MPAAKGGAAAKSGSFEKAKASAVFKKFLPAGKNKWMGVETEAFYNEMGVDCYEDTIVIYIAYLMKCAHMGEILEAEFLTGAEVCGADSIDKWRA